MCDLQELVHGHGGIANVTFIVPMRPVRRAWLIAYTTSEDEYVSVEMRIEEGEDDLYNLDSHYKVKLVPATEELKECFGYETFYQSDLMSMIQRGTIKIKTMECVA